jgi:polyhydroxybutyrate depolymerase
MKFRKIIITIILIILVILLINFLGNRNKNVLIGTITESGIYERSIINDGIHRKYSLYIPTSYNWNAPQPLVLFFHGGGGGMYQAIKDYNWQIKADKEGFALVYMHGSSRRNNKILNTWNAGECCAYARDNNIDDVSYVRLVVKDVKSLIKIDDKKIFATGFSNGAMMSYRLACEASDIFAAIAPVAGTDVTKSCNPENPVSVIHIHARDDEAAKFDGGSGRQFEDTAEWVSDFRSVADTVQLWLEYNDIKNSPKRILEKKDVYCDLYISSQKEVAIQLCVLENGGHTWPGGPSAGRRTGTVPSQALDATAVIWDFFNKL